MSETRLSRRDLVATAAVLPLVAAAATTPAQARHLSQPEMRVALDHLQQALAALRSAGAGYAGHRAEAIRLTSTAIGQVQQAIDFADKHRS